MYICTQLYTYIYIYIFIYIARGDDTVGNPHRAQIMQLESFELIPSLNLDQQVSIEQFEATVSHTCTYIYIYIHIYIYIYIERDMYLSIYTYICIYV